MGVVIDRFYQLQQYLTIQEENLYQKYEGYQFTNEQILKSIKFVMSSNATDYRVFHDVQPYLRGVIWHMSHNDRFQKVEQMISMEQDSLWVTAKYVIFMYQKYLERVVPTNITFYHFMRQKEFYTHYIALKYIMVIGFGQLSQNKHIFTKLKTNHQIQLFKLLLDWLLKLIYYRSSAIFLKSFCIDPLIRQAHLLLSALLGFNNHSILGNLVGDQLKDIYNKLMYINSFLLSLAIPTKNYLSISIILTVIRKLLTSTSHQKITSYLPSYLFAQLIGFIHTPFTHQIIYRLIIYFLTIKLKERSSQQPNSQDYLNIQSQQMERLIVDCWSVLCLLVEEFQLDKQVMKKLIINSILLLKNQSMIRGFVIRIIRHMNLDIEQQQIRKYAKNNSKPYLFRSNVIKEQIFCKNYHIVKQKYYLEHLHLGSMQKWLKISQRHLWQQIINYNKLDIESMQEYLKRIQDHQKKNSL